MLVHPAAHCNFPMFVCNSKTCSFERGEKKTNEITHNAERQQLQTLNGQRANSFVHLLFRRHTHTPNMYRKRGRPVDRDSILHFWARKVQINAMCHRCSVHCYAVSNSWTHVPDKHTNRCRDKEHTFIQSNGRCGKMLYVHFNHFNRMSWSMLRSFASGPFASMRFEQYVFFFFCNLWLFSDLLRCIGELVVQKHMCVVSYPGVYYQIFSCQRPVLKEIFIVCQNWLLFWIHHQQQPKQLSPCTHGLSPCATLPLLNASCNIALS